MHVDFLKKDKTQGWFIVMVYYHNLSRKDVSNTWGKISEAKLFNVSDQASQHRIWSVSVTMLVLSSFPSSLIFYYSWYIWRRHFQGLTFEFCVVSKWNWIPWNTLHRVYCCWCWRLRFSSYTCLSPYLSFSAIPWDGLRWDLPDMVLASHYSPPGKDVLRSLCRHHFPWGASNTRCIDGSALSVFCLLRQQTSSMDKSW